MRNKVVTVFGGSGFIGRYVVQRLAEERAVIRVPTQRVDQAVKLKPLGAVGQIFAQSWNPKAEGEVERLLVGSHMAVNLIGILHERRAGDFDRVHGQLPGKIGAAAAKLGLSRVVHVSAIGTDPSSPSTYARSKAAGETNLRASFPSATILRPSIIVGPEDGFFNRFARMAQLSPALPLIGGGHTRFQPVYVCDVASAIMAALTRDDAVGKTYELGGPTVYTFKDLLAFMLKITGRRRLLLNLPFGMARLQGRILERLPSPLLTADQVELLRHDNVVTPGAPGLAELGIRPEPIEVVVPRYLRAYARIGTRMPVT